jgi:ribonuclease HI
MRVQVVADFIVAHLVNDNEVMCLIEASAWELFFDGPECSRRQGIGCVVVSPSGAVAELSVRLEFRCMNNHAEYQALLYGLEYLRDMGVGSISAFGDSQLVVQQVTGESNV